MEKESLDHVVKLQHRARLYRRTAAFQLQLQCLGSVSLLWRMHVCLPSEQSGGLFEERSVMERTPPAEPENQGGEVVRR